MVADQLKLPFIYVRPKPKDHGLSNQIEGYFEEGQNTVLVEDLVSTGMSSLQVAAVLKKAGLQVMGMTSIFNYSFSVSEKIFTEAAIQYYSLTDYPTVIQLAIEKGLISKTQEGILLKWRENPSAWTGVL